VVIDDAGGGGSIGDHDAVVRACLHALRLRGVVVDGQRHLGSVGRFVVMSSAVNCT